MNITSGSNVPTLAELSMKEFSSKTKSELSDVKLGKYISKGCFGSVYEDSSDLDYVVKVPYVDVRSLPDEHRAFKLFYGEDSADLVIVEKQLCLRMIKIPGIPLCNLKSEDIPDNIITLVMNLIISMRELGLFHNDLSLSNILFDKHLNNVFPIDINNRLQLDTNRKNDPNYMALMNSDDFYMALNMEDFLEKVRNLRLAI